MSFYVPGEMSNVVLTFLILLGALSPVLSYNVRDDASWFKDRERITDPFLVGMISGRNSPCNTTVNGLQMEGVCLPARECVLKGGTKGSACAFLGTCCVIHKTCGEETNVKLSYFTTPKTFQPDCALTVKPMNKDVCQIRLDFEKFSIAQPTQPDELDFETGRSFQCYQDAFTVTSGGSGNLGFEHICGENSKQHIYVPVTNQNSIVLRFQLSQINDGSLNFRDWRIKIRQLVCSKLYTSDLNSVHSSLTMMHNLHHNHRRLNATDLHLIAPNGCLQYYPERTGSYESFNFNQNNGPYIGKMKYAICFRRTPDICGIRHTAQFFVMNYNVREAENELFVECHKSEPANFTTSQDSLQIPGGVFDKKHMEYFCDEQLKNKETVTSSIPGPLYVIVRTDGYRLHDRVEIGFRMDYELLNTGCDVAE